jgi:hypothetical protein
LSARIFLGVSEKGNCLLQRYGSYSHEDWLRGATVDAMNRTYGFRRGFYGEYLYDIPKMSFLKLKVNRKPLSGMYSEVFQKRKGTEDIVAPSFR